MFCVNYFAKAICIEVKDMQISEVIGGQPAPGAEPCRFPKLEECAHFHYERVQLPKLSVTLRTNMDESLHSQHTNEDTDCDWYMIQVNSAEECWLLQRNFENFKMLDDQLHQCIYDRKISQLPDLTFQSPNTEDIEMVLTSYLERFSEIANNSLNCGPVLNWLQMDNKGHRLLVPSEESRSINTPAVAAAYSVRRYVSQARDELNLEVGDMISVIDMASPGESMWWRGKRGFQVGFFPQHCVHIIGDKVPRNMPLPPPVVGTLAITTIKPVLRKHGKLITFFRSFILNRPSRRRLKQTGILKERVFACDLGEHLLNSGHEIPMVLKCCAEFIEKNGIVDGIYRLSGITSNIQKLRNAFDEDRIPNLYTDEILQDIHSVASLLKMYFRELPNPLCTYQLYQSFVNAVQTTGNRGAEGDRERLMKMREAVQKLPPPHYRTLEYLMRHLARVAKHGTRTGMTTRNVAIVWAPNLLRCAELEDGGVTALQGVGVQAVVTEYLICYVDLIFCDHLPNLDKKLEITSTNATAISPKKCRPKSLAISTPTKLITLEEARSKHLLSNNKEDCNYIEVGGGPKNLPKKYHTIIELPSSRKRGHAKRSPLGWRSFFTKSRSNPQTNLKTRKSSTPGISTSEKSITTNENEVLEVRRNLRSVKSAESLTSGHSEPGINDNDALGPLNSLHKPPGHNRSISHDSYFDMLQNSRNNSEGSLLDLSEIQLNFDLEETEMRIFSDDESLILSPKAQRDSGHRKILTRARPEEFNSASNSGNPSPKKQARVVLSPPDSVTSRKRTRLEDQLSDIQFIDCNSPENIIVSTTAIIHTENRSVSPCIDEGEPKNKSPRNSSNIENDKEKQSNFENENVVTPNSPLYRPLESSSSLSSPTEINYENFDGKKPATPTYENFDKKPTTPTYENVLTTISITYRSPPRSIENSPVKNREFDSIYEDVTIIPEKAIIPTSTASLPIQQASQPELQNFLMTSFEKDAATRPKSLNALDSLSNNENKEKLNLSSSVLYDTNEQLSLFSLDGVKTNDTISNRSSGSNIQYTPSSTSSAPYNFMENQTSPLTDVSLSEILHSSSAQTNTDSNTDLSFPLSSNITPNVTPLRSTTHSLDDLLTPISPKHGLTLSESASLVNEVLVKLDETSQKENNDEVYEQVKYFRRSVHEINELLKEKNAADLKMDDENFDSLENNHVDVVYENIDENGEMKGNVYENIEFKQIDNDKMSVKDLLTKFETTPSNNLSQVKQKKFYEKDGLPPCLRARNLKNQIKTRSLDDEEFKKEFDFSSSVRRKSMDDDTIGHAKTNSLPKILNQPKLLPLLDGSEKELNHLHMSHSTENLVKNSEEDIKKRERIEKYKEERRKILQEKYKTESFKEDKDVLLSRIKIFHKNKDDVQDITPTTLRTRRKSTKSDDNDEISSNNESKNSEDIIDDIKPNSLRARAAVFEKKSGYSSPSKLPKPCKKFKDEYQLLLTKDNKKLDNVKDDDCREKENIIIRHKTEDIYKNERRRHTFDTRERDVDTELKLRRGSIEYKSPRKEKAASPSYCIKDMKAIFESKSKQ